MRGWIRLRGEGPPTEPEARLLERTHAELVTAVEEDLLSRSVAGDRLPVAIRAKALRVDVDAIVDERDTHLRHRFTRPCAAVRIEAAPREDVIQFRRCRVRLRLADAEDGDLDLGALERGRNDGVGDGDRESRISVIPGYAIRVVAEADVRPDERDVLAEDLSFAFETGASLPQARQIGKAAAFARRRKYRIGRRTECPVESNAEK